MSRRRPLVQIEASMQGAPVQNEVDMLTAMRDLYGKVLDFETDQVLARLGIWLVELPDADRRELETSGYWERVGTRATFRAEWPS